MRVSNKYSKDMMMMMRYNAGVSDRHCLYVTKNCLFSMKFVVFLLLDTFHIQGIFLFLLLVGGLEGWTFSLGAECRREL